MSRSIVLAALAGTASLVQGHFRFVCVAHNGVWQDPGRYIRNTSDPFYEPFNPDPYDQRPQRQFSDPAYYADAPNSVRCGRGNMNSSTSTEVLKVKTGDTFEFVTAKAPIQEYADENWNCPDGRGFCTYRPVQYGNTTYTSLYVS